MRLNEQQTYGIEKVVLSEAQIVYADVENFPCTVR